MRIVAERRCAHLAAIAVIVRCCHQAPILKPAYAVSARRSRVGDVAHAAARKLRARVVRQAKRITPALQAIGRSFPRGDQRSRILLLSESKPLVLATRTGERRHAVADHVAHS